MRDDLVPIDSYLVKAHPFKEVGILVEPLLLEPLMDDGGNRVPTGGYQASLGGVQGYWIPEDGGLEGRDAHVGGGRCRGVQRSGVGGRVSWRGE